MKMAYRFLCIFFIAQSALAGFFEFSEVEDPLQSLWQNEKLEKKLTECRVMTKSGVKYGSCVPYGSCMLSGGAANGFCGILQTCCIHENTCGRESDTKVGYFEANEVSDGVTTCNFVIKLRNTNICQVRLDFVKFNLAPATVTIPKYTNQQIYKCNDDRLRIVPNYFGIPDLCGNNDKQHVYVHVNQTDGVTKGVQLQVTLADRNYNPHLSAASWKIKITQLQCPGEQKGFHLPKLDADQDVIQDFPMLAPLGTIQYFTDRTGYFKSFGFDGAIQKQQSYTYEQNYAIGFRRDINTCGILFTPDYINLPFDNYAGIYTDKDCKHYLYVPELYFENQLSSFNSLLVSKVCIREAAPFKSHAPGPFYVHFNSMMTNFTSDTVNQKQGFNIQYKLMSECT